MTEPRIATICGSTQFRAEMAAANRDLTLAGYLVFAPGVFAHDGDEITEEQKAALDLLHLRKIDMAELVFIVNPGSYIGESTRREIDYARRAGKDVQFLEPPGEPRRPAVVVHHCPPRDSSRMPCCGKSPLELPDYDCITLYPELVTCDRKKG